MLKVIEKEGNTVEEALKLALSELCVDEDQVVYEIIEETSTKGIFGFFSKKSVKIKVSIKKQDTVNLAKDFLDGIFKKMSMDVLIEKFSDNDKNITLNLQGANLGLLIGKHGQTLDALQYLTNLVANKDQGEWSKFTLDIENYRKRREETLKKLAFRLADKAKRKDERIVLEPMNSNERKIIHTALQDDKRIVTYSEGEEPHRHIVIMLKK